MSHLHRHKLVCLAVKCYLLCLQSRRCSVIESSVLGIRRECGARGRTWHHLVQTLWSITRSHPQSITAVCHMRLWCLLAGQLVCARKEVHRAGKWDWMRTPTHTTTPLLKRSSSISRSRCQFLAPFEWFCNSFAVVIKWESFTIRIINNYNNRSYIISLIELVLNTARVLVFWVYEVENMVLAAAFAQNDTEFHT